MRFLLPSRRFSLSDTCSESLFSLLSYFSLFLCISSLLSRLHLQSPTRLDLHYAAFALQSLGTGLLPRALAVDVEAHVPLLVQVEELLEELGYVMVGLGRRLHEGALPLVSLGFPILGLHLSLGLIALVAHKHDGDGLNIALYGQDLQRSRNSMLCVSLHTSG